MTKDLVLSNLRNIGRKNDVSGYDRLALRMAADLIENQAREIDALKDANAAKRDELEKLRWIPVEEELPDPFVSVLGSMPSNAPFPTVHECYVDYDGKWHSAWCYGTPKVSHWMKAPDGPKEDA